MARRKRSELYVPSEIAIVHVMNRTNHGIYLFGEDPGSGRNCDHRKMWMENRLQLHAACFGIDLLGFSILSNHFHQLLRSRPDIVATWSDKEVARRWLTLCPEEFDELGIPLEPTAEQIDRLCRQTKRLKEIRVRLSDISWWMRLFNQMIAQWVNREEGIVGHVWQGRFKAVRLLDEISLLACSVYVDLNPIRAALAETLKTSRHTSAYHRILSLEELKLRSAELERLADSEPPTSPEETLDATVMAAVTSSTSQDQSESNAPRRVRHGYCGKMTKFLAPIELTEATGDATSITDSSRLRCSNTGFLDMTTADYLTLLDWTAQKLKAGSSGSFPSQLVPLFERLGISAELWLTLVRRFRKSFGEFAGTPSEIASYGERHGQRRFRLPKQTQELFASPS